MIAPGVDVMSSPVGGVIVAAGRSSRMGRSKAHLRIEGEMALARLARVMRESGCDPVVIVAAGDALISAWCMPNVAVLEGDPDATMIDSIARGLTAVGLVSGAVVQPIDAPFTTRKMLATLLDHYTGTSRILTYAGKPGHPVLVARALFPAIAARPEGGLRALLEQSPVQRVPFDDERILADLDTPEDVARWMNPV